MKRCRIAEYVFLLLLVALATGCATGTSFKQVSEIPQGKGLVYVYRPSGIVGCAVSYDVHAAQENIGHLYPGGYLTYFASPGELEVWGKTESRGSVTVDVRAGEAQYVKASLGVGILMGRPVLIVVEPQVGRSEIESCKQKTSN